MSGEFEFDRYAAFQVLEELCDLGPRVIASDGELRSAQLLSKKFREFGLSDNEIIRYPFKYYDGLEATLSTVDGNTSISGVPCWMSASTPKDGVEAETLYIGSHNLLSDYSKKEIQEKIVFVLLDQQYMPEVLEAWDKLYKMDPAGVVFLDRLRNEAPRSYNYQKLDEIFSKAPSMTTSAKLAKPLHNQMFGSRLCLVVQGEAKDGTIHNVQGLVKGQLDTTIIVCAHHDSVPFTMGATDNAAGVAIVVELARILSMKDTKFSYQFITFGGEELEMKGSQNFLEDFELGNTLLCMNFDSIGALPGEALGLAAGPDEMIEWLTGLAQTNKYPTRCRRVATSGGDNIPFAARGIPTIHFACMGTTTE
ncbi:MAG: M28 family metallopeptidase, partial [Candidatus Thorarchaeota archaeon]